MSGPTARRRLAMQSRSINTELRRFRGSMLGAAVGDALGAPLERLGRDQIRELHGGEVDKYVLTARHPSLALGQWTDDTALSLATAASIIESDGLDVENVRLSMLLAFNRKPKGFGLTVRNALDPKGRRGKPRPTNGAAMRIHPVALLYSGAMDQMRENVIAVSRLTHTHPDAVDAALAVAFAVATAARGELSPATFISETIRYLPRESNMGYKLTEVGDLLSEDISTEDALERIGTRGLALETVGSAFYAFLRTPDDFGTSVVSAVNAGGDTDTIGSITGAISGAHNGVGSIPKRWLNGLKSRNVIDEMSRRLFEKRV